MYKVISLVSLAALYLLLVVSGIMIGVVYEKSHQPWCATEDSCKPVLHYGSDHRWTVTVESTVP